MHNWGEGGEDGRKEDPELAGTWLRNCNHGGAHVCVLSPLVTRGEMDPILGAGRLSASADEAENRRGEKANQVPPQTKHTATHHAPQV